MLFRSLSVSITSTGGQRAPARSISFRSISTSNDALCAMMGEPVMNAITSAAISWNGGYYMRKAGVSPCTAIASSSIRHIGLT